MSCPAYHVLISRYVDDALDEGERADLLLHLGRCSSCRLTLARYRRLDERLRQLSAAEAPSDCRRVLFQRAEAERPWFQAIAWLRPTTLAATSAALAVLLLASLLLPALSYRFPQQGIAIHFPGDASRQEAVRLTLPGGTTRVAAADNPEITLAGYLPPAAGVEHVALRWDEAAPSPAYVQIVFVAPHGPRVRFERSAADPPSAPIGDRMPDSVVLVHGQVWRYTRHISADGVEIVRLIRSTSSGDIISLEGRVPLQELVHLIEWLQ